MMVLTCGVTVSVVYLTMLLLQPMTVLAASLTYHSVNDGPPCPGNTITYVCDAIETDRLIWTVSLPSTGEIDTIEFIRPQAEQGSVQELTILDDTLVATLVLVTAIDLESNLTVTVSHNLDRATIMCSNNAGAVSSTTIIITDTPSTPQNLMASIIPSVGDSVLINLEWDIDFLTSSELGGNYTISTTPTTTPSVTTNPHFILSLSFNIIYTVSVTATNCAGNSGPAEIQVGPFSPPMATSDSSPSPLTTKTVVPATEDNSPSVPLDTTGATITTTSMTRPTTEMDGVIDQSANVSTALIIAIAVPASLLVLAAMLLTALAVAVSICRTKRKKGPPTITAPAAHASQPGNNIECDVIRPIHNIAYAMGSTPTTTDEAGYEIMENIVRPDYHTQNHYNTTNFNRVGHYDVTNTTGGQYSWQRDI